MKEKRLNPQENKLHLFKLWDKKYNNSQGNGTELFSGRIQGYEYKRIEDSEFVILRNKERMEKKVNHIENEMKQSVKSLPIKHKIASVLKELKQTDFYFQKIHPEEIVVSFNEELDEVVHEKNENILTETVNQASNKKLQ